MCLLELKIYLYKNISLRYQCQLSKHQLDFKQKVILVENWAWQPKQELLREKTVQIRYLFPVPSSIPTFSWITVNLIPNSNNKRDLL